MINFQVYLSVGTDFLKVTLHADGVLRLEGEGYEASIAYLVKKNSSNSPIEQKRSLIVHRCYKFSKCQTVPIRFKYQPKHQVNACLTFVLQSKHAHVEFIW